MSRRKHGPLDRLPADLRPLVGGAVLVAAVRAVDVAWRLVTRRPVPTTGTAATATGTTTSDAAGTTAATDTADATDPAVVRDRLAYAALLSGALRVARRLGLPRDPR